jgi:hypothetical protein
LGPWGPEKKSGGPSIIKSKKKPEDPKPKRKKKELHTPKTKKKVPHLKKTKRK